MASFVPADEYLFSFLLLISSAVILLGSGSGLDVFQIPQQRQALPVTGNPIGDSADIKRTDFELTVLGF